jgi:hypothetical protein
MSKPDNRADDHGRIPCLTDVTSCRVRSMWLTTQCIAPIERHDDLSERGGTGAELSPFLDEVHREIGGLHVETFAG